MRVKSFAKINLGIEILGKRADGYHEIRTLYQVIDLFDLIEIAPIPRNAIILTGDDPSIPWDGSNLIHKAGTLLKGRFPIEQGVEIRVTKRIPAGRGLGGGSSNAAMTLLALNKIWDLGLSRKDLRNLGSLLGADVPFFFEGGLCLGLGIGSQVMPQKDLDPYLCVLVLPPISVSTAFVYEEFRVALTSRDKESKIIRFLDSHDFDLLDNELEETVFRTYPQIKALKSHIQKQGSELTLMSGSGSAVFGLFRQRTQAEEVVKKLSKEHAALCVTTLSREDYWSKIDTGV